jgi:hypothetical protein
MHVQRWMPILSALTLLLIAGKVEAQITQPIELRFDFLGVEFDPFVVDAFIPGSASVGVFLNERFAAEGSIGVVAGDDDWLAVMGLSLPFYLNADYGRSGLFVAPVLEVLKVKDVDALFDYGVDVGVKIPASPRTSWRLAATVRDGDSYESVGVGLSAGVSLLFRYSRTAPFRVLDCR